MVIENRNLPVGTVLAVTYKKQEHRCEVVKTDKGMGFQLANGSVYSSLSSAGKAITGRVSCDGWKFWSLANGAAPTATTETEEAAIEPFKPKVKLVRQIKKLPNQKGVPEGMTKFHCSACMESFLSETEPETCPAGHPRETADEFGATPKDTASAD